MNSYFYVSSVYEEKKLIGKFGKTYSKHEQELFSRIKIRTV